MKNLFALLLLTVGIAHADPVAGVWQTIDEETKSPTSLVRLEVVGDTLRGSIVKIFPRPGQPAEPVCELCKDERQGKPILGMTILTGLKRSANGVWTGGEILDPKNGKVYKAKLTAAENGKTMEVRGYIGAPVLGRTVVWRRD